MAVSKLPICVTAMRSGRSEQGRRHRSLIDVIQDLEQENAAEVASSGVSPASDRPVPLDLSGAISDPLPDAEAQQRRQQQASGLVSHRLQHSEDGSEAVSCPPGTDHLLLPVFDHAPTLYISRLEPGLCLSAAHW